MEEQKILQKPGQKREQYDLCVSRAVANLASLSEYCLPYVKIGGEFISYKSGRNRRRIVRMRRERSFYWVEGWKNAVHSLFQELIYTVHW